MDTDSIGIMYCANHYNCPYCNCTCSNSSGDGSWINNDLNSIWCSMLNKRHGRLIPVRRRNGHTGVHSIRNVNGSNIAKYSYINEVMR